MRSTRLDPVTGEQIDESNWTLENENFVHLANGATVAVGGKPTDEDQWLEAPYLHKQGDHYYLFVNWYRCCAGHRSTYEIRGGRSSAATGPFVDAVGHSMLEGGGTLLLDGSSSYIGPGHVGIMQYTSAVDGKTKQVLTHHHYPKNGTPWATMAAQMLTWSEDGWPVLDGTLFDPMDYWGKKK